MPRSEGGRVPGQVGSGDQSQALAGTLQLGRQCARLSTVTGTTAAGTWNRHSGRSCSECVVAHAQKGKQTKQVSGGGFPRQLLPGPRPAADSHGRDPALDPLRGASVSTGALGRGRAGCWFWARWCVPQGLASAGVSLLLLRAGSAAWGRAFLPAPLRSLR